MDSLLLARWQFGITTGYHFLFVPLTIGTASLTAVLQTAWLCSGRERYQLATKFCGELFLIGFALGSATGIVQEFQLGMAATGRARFAGAGLGAQPATEGLLAFFLESVLLGLWIFGWERLPRGVHTACIWLAALGITLAAYFVPATGDAPPGPARPAGGWAGLGDPARLLAFAPTVAAALLAAGALLVAGSAWHLRRGRHQEMMRPSLRVGLCSTAIGGAGTAATAAVDVRLLTDRRPAGATATAAAVLHPLSATAHWGLRALICLGLLAVLTALFGFWYTRAATGDGDRARFHLVATRVVPLMPLGAGVGWMFAEAGRRPRMAAHGGLRAAQAGAPGMDADRMWTLLTVLTLLYALLAVVEIGLVLRTARRGPVAAPAWDGDTGGPEPELGFAY